MKFLASKKLSDNSTLRGVIVWMLLLFILAMFLSLSAKGIAFGFTPKTWIETVMGNPEEFTDPMLFSDLLLGIHTDLFGLIITFILIASLYVRTSRPTPVKIGLFSLMLCCLLMYPVGLLSASLLGGGAIIAAIGAFTLFHALIVLISADLLMALMLKRL